MHCHDHCERYACFSRSLHSTFSPRTACFLVAPLGKETEKRIIKIKNIKYCLAQIYVLFLLLATHLFVMSYY